MTICFWHLDTKFQIVFGSHYSTKVSQKLYFYKILFSSIYFVLVSFENGLVMV
jgi:hypothetical protein